MRTRLVRLGITAAAIVAITAPIGSTATTHAWTCQGPAAQAACTVVAVGCNAADKATKHKVYCTIA